MTDLGVACPLPPCHRHEGVPRESISTSSQVSQVHRVLLRHRGDTCSPPRRSQCRSSKSGMFLVVAPLSGWHLPGQPVRAASAGPVLAAPGEVPRDTTTPHGQAGTNPHQRPHSQYPHWTRPFVGCRKFAPAFCPGLQQGRVRYPGLVLSPAPLPNTRSLSEMNRHCTSMFPRRPTQPTRYLHIGGSSRKRCATA